MLWLLLSLALIGALEAQQCTFNSNGIEYDLSSIADGDLTFGSYQVAFCTGTTCEVKVDQDGECVQRTKGWNSRTSDPDITSSDGTVNVEFDDIRYVIWCDDVEKAKVISVRPGDDEEGTKLTVTLTAPQSICPSKEEPEPVKEEEEEEDFQEEEPVVATEPLPAPEKVVEDVVPEKEPAVDPAKVVSYDVFDDEPLITEAPETKAPVVVTEPPKPVVVKKEKRRIQTDAPYIPPARTLTDAPQPDSQPYIPPAKPRDQSGASGPIIPMEGHWMGYATCEHGCTGDANEQIGIDFRLITCGQGYFYTWKSKMTTIRPYHCDRQRILATLHTLKGETVGYIFFIFNDERSLTASVNWIEGNKLWQMNAERMDYR